MMREEVVNKIFKLLPIRESESDTYFTEKLDSTLLVFSALGVEKGELIARIAMLRYLSYRYFRVEILNLCEEVSHGKFDEQLHIESLKRDDI